MEAILLDPQSRYADHFIDLLWHRNIRTVALHRSWRSRILDDPARFPTLNSAAVSAHYVIGDRPLADVARMLQARHRIVAVVPHHESSVLPLHELAQRLHLDWAQPEVLPMFRDKGRLKDHLRRQDPGLRVNQTRVVRTGQEALEFLAHSRARRLVLKPNDGAGNVDVAFFDANATQEQLQAHIERIPGAVLAEEYVGGDEFFVNGQVDASGNVHIITVSGHVHGAHAGKENVSLGQRVLKTTDPDFPALAEYARRVVSATGLRRSPFHMEAKVDDHGPCLIEVAARLCGVDVAFEESRVHGFDVLATALDHYLGEVTEAPPLDWAAYDRTFRGSVLGVSARNGIISRLHGVAEVESMPQFVAWVDKPRIGQKVQMTVDLPTAPWSANLEAPTPPELEAAREAITDLISWDDTLTSPQDRARGTIAYTRDKTRVLAQAPRLLTRTTLRWH